MRTFIQRHGVSNGARLLARALGVRMLRLQNSGYRYRRGDRIINWGASERMPGAPRAAYLNDPSAVAATRSKVDQYRTFEESGVPHPVWTEDPNVARGWFVPGTNQPKVMTRSITRGSQGRGISVYSYEGTTHTEDYNRFIHADRVPLYVQVFGDVRTNTEFRLHVLNGEVFDAQMKRRRSRENGYEGEINPYVRSAENGWVFCRDGVTYGAAEEEAAKEAVSALGLDFGAVDLARSASGEVCVYEVNTAPGLTGTTVGRYAGAFG